MVPEALSICRQIAVLQEYQGSECDQEDTQTCQRTPFYSLADLNRINSPNGLTTTLETDLHDDFTKPEFSIEKSWMDLLRSGQDVAREPSQYLLPLFILDLNGVTKFVNAWQNFETGYWGQWLVDRDGNIWKMDDMAHHL